MGEFTARRLGGLAVAVGGFLLVRVVGVAGMMTVERWTELLEATPEVVPRTREELDRLKAFEPMPTVIAWAVSRALPGGYVRPWWAD